MGASWKTLSLIGAMRLGERPRRMTHRGAVNGRIFLASSASDWRRRFASATIVMDKLNVHKMRAVRDAIEAANVSAMYLPSGAW